MRHLESVPASLATAGLGVALAFGLFPSLSPPVSGQSDLDAFMQQVVARRDDNWKKLQQYVLDEHEEMALGGPGGARLFGQERDYTWYIREGFFVRSPVKFDGVTISEADRRKAEDEYLRRAKRRDERAARGDTNTQGGNEGLSFGDDLADLTQAAGPTSPANPAPMSVDALLRQSRQPRFISSAYFLRFSFDRGTYALAGREKYEGRDVLRIEYYPTRLFRQDPERHGGREGRGAKASDKPDGEDRGKGADKEKNAEKKDVEKEMMRLLNKVALVTIWVEPDSHQIVKYTFDNVDFDFLPAAWLVRVDDLKASMTMGQPFPGVWLPRDIDMKVGIVLATGPLDFRMRTSYTDYREPDVNTRFIPGAPARR